MSKKIKNVLSYDGNLLINNDICSKLEQDLFKGINQIRQNPREFQIIYYKNNFKKIKDNFNNSTELAVIHLLSRISKQNIKFPLLQKLPELAKLSHEILTYINNLYIKTNSINYEFFTPKNLNLGNRCLSYGHIKGKYFEGIIINSINYMQVINYIMRDVKGRKIIFDSRVKYIGISCGFLKKGEICTVIDIIQDFIPNEIDINITTTMNNSNRRKQIKNKYKERNGKSVDDIILKRNKKQYTNIMPENNFSLTFTSNFNKKKNINKDKFIEPIASFKSNSKIHTKVSKSVDTEIKNKFSINNINTASIFCLAGREKNNTSKNSEKIDSKPNSISRADLSHISRNNSRNGNRDRRLSQQEKISILKQINESNRNNRSKNHQKIYSKTPLKNINSNTKTISLISSDNSNLNENSNNNSFLRNKELENELNELKIEVRHLKQQISSPYNIDQQNSNAISYISSINNQDKSKDNITKSSIGDNGNTYKILLDKMENGNERTITPQKNKSSDYYKKNKICRIKKQNITNNNNKIIKIGNANCNIQNIGVYKHKSPIDRKMLSNRRNRNQKMINMKRIYGEAPVLNTSINESFNTGITIDKIIRVPKKIINTIGSFNYNPIAMKNYSSTTKFNENKNTKFSIKKIGQNDNIK